MKRLVFFIIIMNSFVAGYAQLAVTGSVSISADSTSTVIHQFQSVMQAIQTVSNTLETVKGVASMIENQAKSVESLSSGTFDGLVQAWDYQVESLGNFSGVLDGMDALPQLQSVSENPDFQTTRESVKLLNKSLKQSSNLLHAAQSTIKNTKNRADAFSNLQTASNGNQSVVTQMQLTTQAIGLVQGQLADVNNNLAVLAITAQTQQDIEAAQAALLRKQNKEFVRSRDGDDEIWRGSYTDEEAMRAYRGPVDPDSTLAW